MPAFTNSLDPDQLVSEENPADPDLHSLSLNVYQQPWYSILSDWKLEVGVAS